MSAEHPSTQWSCSGDVRASDDVRDSGDVRASDDAIPARTSNIPNNTDKHKQNNCIDYQEQPTWFALKNKNQEHLNIQVHKFFKLRRLPSLQVY